MLRTTPALANVKALPATPVLIEVAALPATAVDPKVNVEPATAAEYVVAAEPATAVERVVATLPATAELSRVSALPATARLLRVATDGPRDSSASGSAGKSRCNAATRRIVAVRTTPATAATAMRCVLLPSMQQVYGRCTATVR